MAAFAAELRELCAAAAMREGSSRNMFDIRELEQRARLIGRPRSRSVLSEALRGNRLPSWETTDVLVEILSGDAAEWKARYEKTKLLSLGVGAASALPDVEVVAVQDEESGIPESDQGVEAPPRKLLSPTTRRSVYFLLSAVTVILAAVILAVVIIGGQQPPTTGPRRVSVQNMVAIGPSSLVEDDSPAYLSRRAIARCSERGCKIAGTEMNTGASVIAVCQKHGQSMSNADESSPGVAKNRAAARSARWYGVRRHGVFGFLSEVFIRPHDRGGFRLPNC